MIMNRAKRGALHDAHVSPHKLAAGTTAALKIGTTAALKIVVIY